MVLIWFEPEREPSKHIFNDLPLLKSELDAWGGQFLFLSDSLDSNNSFNPENIKGLPANSIFGIDNKMTLFRNHIKFTLPPEVDLPVVVITDKDGNVYFISMGYKIGIGEQILKFVNKY